MLIFNLPFEQGTFGLIREKSHLSAVRSARTALGGKDFRKNTVRILEQVKLGEGF